MNNVNASSGRTTCANAEQLERYLNDQMDPHEEAQIESHLSVCTECQHALEAAGGNADWWSEVRTSVLSNPAPEDQDQDAHESTRGILNLLAPTDDPEMLGRIGHYEVQGVVGEGSTGVVLRAVDPRLHRVVAIKVLAPTVGLSGPARQRFEREARAVAAVVHDHVVPIYSVDEHQGLPYIVMPYVSGSSLGARIQRDGPLGTREAARVGFQVARALAAAHALGIVHRDVKPANVLVEGSVDRVAVTDFGLASVAGEASMTYSGTIQGTPHYMSPEQARGDAVDPRTDLFSLGSLLYEACTGHPPFQAQTVFGVIRRVCETEPKPIRAVNPDIDEWLEVFVARLMSKQLDTRFQSAHEVAEALGAELAYMQNPSGTARPPRPWWPQLANKAKPFPSVLALSCAALLIAAGGVVALTATQPAPQATARNHAQTQPLTTQTSTTSVHTHRVSQSVPMISGGMLTVRLDHGAVRIVAAETDEITLDFEGVLEAATDDQAAMFIERHSVALAATDVGATLTGLISDTRGWAGARYTLTVPVDTSLDIESDASEVTVGDVSGDIRVLLESGDIQLGHMRGRVDARSNHGNIVMVDGCDGDADLVAIRGSAVMANVSGRASAITSGGDIWLGQSTGRTGAQTAGGNIYVDGAQGSVRAHATGGDVLLWINETPTEDLRVNAANGSVLMMIAENVDAIVEASGDLQAELTFTPIENTEDMGGLWSAATLNAGGPALRASSMTGSVDVRVLESLSGDTLRSVLDRLRQRDDTAPTLGGLATSTADTPSLDHNYTQGLASSPGSGDSTLGGSTPGLGGSSSLGGSAPGLGGSSSLGGSAPGLGGSSTLGGSAPGLGGSSSLGGSAPGLGGSSSLGGSAPGLGGSSSLGGSAPGLGESGSNARVPVPGETNRTPSNQGVQPQPNEPATAGKLTTVRFDDPDAIMDGYTIYLPVSHNADNAPYPVLVFLQGAFGVSDRIEDVNDWGMTRLIRDETNLDSRRNRLLLDGFIVVNPHIRQGSYADHPQVITQIINDVIEDHNGDPTRVYLTGLSRGGHGTWGLASSLPGTFAAIAPIGGNSSRVDDWAALEGTAIWISHNAHDSRVSFDYTQQAMRQLESELGIGFQTYDTLSVRRTDFMDHDHILTSAQTMSHDAWTEIYSNPEFYEWLLRHRLPDRRAPSETR